MESRCQEATFSTINRQSQVRKSTCTHRGKPVERVTFVCTTVKRRSMSWWCSYSASRFSGAIYRRRHRVLFARILAAVHNFAVFVQDRILPLNGSDTPLFRHFENFQMIRLEYFTSFISRDARLRCFLPTNANRQKDLYIYAVLDLNVNKHLRFRYHRKMLSVYKNIYFKAKNTKCAFKYTVFKLLINVQISSLSSISSTKG